MAFPYKVYFGSGLNGFLLNYLTRGTIKILGYKLNQWVLEGNDFVEVEIDGKYDTRKEKLKYEWES